MTQRKWLPTAGELIDRISIVAMKYHFSPDNRTAFGKEIEDLKHDIQIALMDSKEVQITADFLWHVIVLSQFNLHIAYNEKSARNGDVDNSDLYFTHLANGTRCRFRDYINARLHQRQDPKVEALAANLPDFEPPK